MALEIRMIGKDGKLVRTSEDVATPHLPTNMVPGTIMLADYCFNGDGPWVKPQTLLQPEDVAAVVYNRRGKIESMVVGDRRIHDEEQMSATLEGLRHCLLTKYPGKSGKEIFMFYLSPHDKKRVRGSSQLNR